MDWSALLPALGEHCPDLNLSLEDHKGLMAIPIFDPAWRAGHPELTADELAQVVRLAWRCEQRIAAGGLLPPGEYEAIPFAQQREARQQAAVEHLRSVVATAGLG